MTIRPLNWLPTLPAGSSFNVGFIAALVFLVISMISVAFALWGAVLSFLFLMSALGNSEFEIAVIAASMLVFIGWGLVHMPFYGRRLAGRSGWDIAGWSSTMVYNGLIAALAISWALDLLNVMSIIAAVASSGCFLLAGAALLDAALCNRSRS